MRARGAGVQGALAGVGLLAAYATWQRGPEPTRSEAVVLDATKKDLSLIKYTDDKGRTVELTRHDDATWLKLSARDKTPERTVRGSESADKLWEKFAPLSATRSLGALAADKLKEFGLDAPKKRIEVTARGAARAFAVGASPYGVSDPYVKDEADGKVYVLGGGVLSDLDGAASRLIDRSLHTWKQGDWDGLAVSAGGKKRELALVGGAAAPAASAKLAPVGKPDKPDEMAKNWHDKVWRLFVSDVLGQGEKPASGEPQIVARLDYTMKGKGVGWIELARVTPPPPAGTSAPPTAPEVYGRTEHTAGWVKLGGAGLDELLKEADKIAAAE